MPEKVTKEERVAEIAIEHARNLLDVVKMPVQNTMTNAAMRGRQNISDNEDMPSPEELKMKLENHVDDDITNAPRENISYISIPYETLSNSSSMNFDKREMLQAVREAYRGMNIDKIVDGKDPSSKEPAIIFVLNTEILTDEQGKMVNPYTGKRLTFLEVIQLKIQQGKQKIMNFANRGKSESYLSKSDDDVSPWMSILKKEKDSVVDVEVNELGKLDELDHLGEEEKVKSPAKKPKEEKPKMTKDANDGYIGDKPYFG